MHLTILAIATTPVDAWRYFSLFDPAESAKSLLQHAEIETLVASPSRFRKSPSAMIFVNMGHFELAHLWNAFKVLRVSISPLNAPAQHMVVLGLSLIMKKLNAPRFQDLDEASEYPEAGLQIKWIRLVAFLLGHHLGWFITLLFIIAAQPLAFWLFGLLMPN